MKTLILMHNVKEFFGENNNFIIKLYSKQTSNNLYRVIRHIFIKFKFPFYKYFFGDWIKSLHKFDAVLIFDNGNIDVISKRIHELNNSIRIIIWFWNPIKSKKCIDGIDRRICEIWSYNEQDCKKYGLMYNPQFYFENIYTESLPKKISYDVYFIGLDKNERAELLRKIMPIFKKKNIIFKYILVPTSSELDPELKYSNRISYTDNINNILQSKSLLDITNTNTNPGITLRVLEAAYYKKKLITNNAEVKSMKFYSKNNIFLYPEDNIDEDSQIEYYSFRNWLKRFGIQFSNISSS